MDLKEGDTVFAIIEATEVSLEKEQPLPDSAPLNRREYDRPTRRWRLEAVAIMQSFVSNEGVRMDS
jgi:hypothetical protein